MSASAPPQTANVKPFSTSFADSRLALSRKIYLRTLIGGALALIITMFAVFSIYWGALWKTPAHKLQGWIVDFDQNTVGSAVTDAFSQASTSGTVYWSPVDASQFPNGPADVAHAVVDDRTWVAVVINYNATGSLNAAIQSADSSYNGSKAITVYGNEARSENGYRSLISPVVQQTMAKFSAQFAAQQATQLASTSNLGQILSSAPQVITQPVSFTLVNLAPFNIPVATAITFVGLIYLLILSFFIVMIGLSAREISGLEKHLTLGALIRLRLTSTFVAYFFLSLFYSLLSRAFQVDFSRKFGHSGFLVFWMINYVGMLSVGLALEAMTTLLTTRGVPFFMIIFIIVNVSVCFFPIEALPKIYHYGYAMPFYNVSKAVRTILFSTKNQVALNFGVCIAWMAVSCITLPLFITFRRRQALKDLRDGEDGGVFQEDKRVEDETETLGEPERTQNTKAV